MNVVLELLPEGHERLTPAQLLALRDVANRVGFDVVETIQETPCALHRIELKISMRDPSDRFFIARLGERLDRDEDGSAGRD
jgi:hypothetical protein